MDDDTKSLIFILFVTTLVVLSVYSILVGVQNVENFTAKFNDLERACANNLMTKVISNFH